MAIKTKVALCDIDGVLRGKFIGEDKLKSALSSGFGFCSVVLGWDCSDVCYTNAKFSGLHNGYPDAQVRLDESSKREMPLEPGTQFFLADFYDAHDKPLPICPRQVLKAQIKKAQDLGFWPMFGLEFEWFNFKETPQSLSDKNFADLKPLSPGMFGYSLLRMGQNSAFVNELLDVMHKFRVPLEGLHTETGPGVMEAAIVACDALEAADRAVLFKWMTKEVAAKHGLMATFMAKISSSLPGSSGHMHQSLWSLDKKTNVFFEQNRKSALFESYIAGQALLMPELMAFYAPNINSYKRLVEGFWAPTKASYGHDNRTTALRVIMGGEKSSRLETRVGGADINPYLAIAAALGSGLWGIENKLKLELTPVIGSAYDDKDAKTLPKTLSQACDNLQRSTAARKIFGDEFIEHFLLTRRCETQIFERAVTDFELKRYFEVI